MKVAITGHTKGLGKAFYEALPGSLGFSRSNGYDIADPIYRDLIIDESSTCDVFINNAYHPTGQLALLEDLLKTNKMIIHIGSNIIYKEEIVDIYSLREYYEAKMTMHQLCRSRPDANLINVIPGSMDTPMIAHAPVPKMDPREIVNFVLDAIKRPFCVKEVLIDVRAG